MKSTLTKIRFHAALGVICHLFGRAAFLGAVILTCHSVTAQDLYVSASTQDGSGGKVLRFSWDGIRSTFAGDLSNPQGLAMDSAGNLFVADVIGDDPVISVIYKFGAAGVRSTFATLSGLPRDLAFNAAGNLFVVDYGRGDIYEYKPNGTHRTFASGLSRPEGLAFDRAGNLFVGETTYGRIYRYKPDGARTIFASGFSNQSHLVCDSSGNLFVSGTLGDSIISGHVYKITPNGARTVFASGLCAPGGLAFDYRGNLFVADLGIPQGRSVIYEFTPAAKRSTFGKAAASDDPMLKFNYLAFQPLQVLPNDRPR